LPSDVRHTPVTGSLEAQVVLAIAGPTRLGPGYVVDTGQAVLQPRNPLALHTLGQLCLMQDDPAAALPHLRAAATVAPEDRINLFTYGHGLLAIEGESRAAEGDGLLRRALQLAPVGELGEKIKAQQRQLATRVIRANAKGEPRRDAVTYLSGALEAYRALDLEVQKQLLAEVAAISEGLAINDPQQSLHLRLYRGGSTVSTLQAPASSTSGFSCCCLGRMRGLIWGGSTSWPGGWWGEGREQLWPEWRVLMAVLSEVAAVGQGGLQVNEAGSTSRRLPVAVGDHPADLLLLGGAHQHRAGLLERLGHKRLALLALGLLDRIPAAQLRGIDSVEPHAVAQGDREAQIQIEIHRVAVDDIGRRFEAVDVGLEAGG
jgi:hypothetical protein